MRFIAAPTLARVLRLSDSGPRFVSTAVLAWLSDARQAGTSHQVSSHAVAARSLLRVYAGVVADDGSDVGGVASVIGDPTRCQLAHGLQPSRSGKRSVIGTCTVASFEIWRRSRMHELAGSRVTGRSPP